jgi:hypothetical protein
MDLASRSRPQEVLFYQIFVCNTRPFPPQLSHVSLYELRAYHREGTDIHLEFYAIETLQDMYLVASVGFAPIVPAPHAPVVPWILFVFDVKPS